MSVLRSGRMRLPAEPAGRRRERRASGQRAARRSFVPWPAPPRGHRR
ncbi:hypothetical protein [Ornithinimicrobium kibberense]